MNLFFEAIAAVPVLYLAFAAVIVATVARSAREPIKRTPASLGLKFEEISFPSRTDNLAMKGWHIAGNGKGTIIVTHGGKSNRADEGIGLLDLCADLAREGFNVLTFDRRDCGDSAASGLRAKARFERDVGGAFDHVRRRSGRSEPVFLLGISLGAMASILFSAEQDGVSGVVCDSCFASTGEMARRVLSSVNAILPVFMPAASLLAQVVYRYQPVDPVDRVGAVRCPMLFITGENDPSVPAEDAHRLLRRSANSLNEVWIAPQSGHSMCYRRNSKRYIKRVVSFLVSKCGAGASHARVPARSIVPVKKAEEVA